MSAPRQPTRFESLLRVARRNLWDTVRDYIVIVRGRSEGAGFSALSELSRHGLLTWPGLVVLAMTVVAAAYLTAFGEAFPPLQAEIWEGEVVQAPTPSLALSLLVWALAWSYLLAGAALAGPGWYCLVATYAAFFAGYIIFGLQTSAWFALLPLWLLILGVWVVASHRKHGRWKALWLLPLAGVTALLTRPVLGLSHFLPDVWGAIVLTLIYFVLAANPLALRPRTFRPALALCLSAAILIGANGWALYQSDPHALMGATFVSFHYLYGLVGLIWYGVGLDLFNGAQDLGEWATNALQRLVPHRALVIGVWILWALWIAGAWIAVYGPPMALVQVLSLSRLGLRAVQAYIAMPDLAFTSAMVLQYHLYVMAALCVVALALRITRRLTPQRIVRLLFISMVSLVALAGYFGLYMASAGSETLASGFVPMLLFVVGIFWQILQIAADITTGSEMRRWSFLGFLLLLGGITLLELSAHYALYQLEIGLNTYLGIVYLALPYWGYRVLTTWRRRQPIAASVLLALFVLGMVSAMPVLMAQRAFFLPILWAMALWLILRRRGVKGDAWDGAIYGLALGMGFAFYYADPFQIPIPAYLPILGLFVQRQIDYSGRILWTWTPGFWSTLGIGLTASAWLGLALVCAHQAVGWRKVLWIALGLMGSVGLCLGWEWLGPLP